MKQLIFCKEPSKYINDTEFISFLPKVIGKEALLSTLGTILKFPWYYGCNWDALVDCLRDFDWIKKKGIVLVHIEIPKLSKEELKIYVEILIYSIRDWKESEDHYFKVIFPEETEQLIMKLVGSLQ